MTPEDSFHDRIEDELAGLRPPPIGGLAGEALALGRRIRRRERVVGVVGGTAAVAGVAAGVLALSGGFASGGAARTSAAAGGPIPAPVTKSSPVASPTTPSTPPTSAQTAVTPLVPSGSSSPSGPTTVIGTIPASWKAPAPAGGLKYPTDTDGQSVAELVIDGLEQMGSGSGSGFTGGTLPGMNANSTLTWSTQHRSVRISASVSNEGPDGKVAQSVCYPAYELDYCAVSTLGDGSVVMVEHGTGEPASGPPTHNNMVTLTRPNHIAINVVEWSNGPLTDDQLYKIVADPRWAMKMDGSFVSHADAVIRPFSG